MAAARDRRRRICGKRTQARTARTLCVLFWGAVWLWFGARTLRTAGRILAAPASTQPVSGRVLNAYSGDELVYSSTLGDWRTHNGVDYACAQDAQVCAPAAGKVTAVDTDGRWGSVVCIEDSAGRIWRVCGTTDPAVHTGDEVSVGQALGRAGSIPNECAEETHIHLEVMQGGTYLDPAKLLG